MHKADLEKLVKMGISEINSDIKEGSSGPPKIEEDFMKNFKFRIDARIVKTMKHKKKMKL